MPEIRMDFCFMGEEGEPGNTLLVLVAKEEATKMKLSAAVPTKSSGTYIAKRVVAWMKEIGCEMCDITMKTDQEPATQAIVKEIGKIRAANGGGKYIVEMSPVASSKSNGSVERAILSVEQMVRALRSALGRRWKRRIPTRHPVMAWIVEYAGHLLNRFEVSRDGKTAYERCKGKRSKSIGVEFGEAVLWKKKMVGGALGKLDCTWSDGVFLGVRGKSGEIYSRTSDGNT